MHSVTIVRLMKGSLQGFIPPYITLSALENFNCPTATTVIRNHRPTFRGATVRFAEVAMVIIALLAE